MLQQHRARIDSCRDILVQRLNIIELWPKLFQHKIFNVDDVNIARWQNTLGESATKREILMTIKTRGPHAFDNLLKSLREIGQTELAVILEGSIDTPTNNNANNFHNLSLNLPQNIPDRLRPNNPQNYEVENSDDINNLLDILRIHDDQPVVINVRKSTRFLDEGDCHIISRYPMQSKPRGLVLVITLMNYTLSKKLRRAAEYDHANLVELFQQMGFEVVQKRDLTASEIRRAVFEFSQKSQLRRVDSCFVIVSGHGNKSADGRTVISGIDDTGNHNPDHEISCLEIIEFFSVEKCPNLSRKPKIFIFQVCRGAFSQYAVMDRGGSNAMYNENIRITNADVPRDFGTRNYSDILIVHSTLPGYVSFRDNVCGSWFIQTLCKVFMMMAWALPVRDLFNKIDELIASKRTGRNECQTTTVKSVGFFKHLYINPGLFLEE